MRKRSLLLLFIAFMSSSLFGQEDLVLSKDDLYVEERTDGGFHLFVRKKPGIESVLVAQSTKDPLMQINSYVFRAKEYNSVNGDETIIRRIDGVDKVINNRTSKLYAIVDTTLEPNEKFGLAFHLFVPYSVTFGYATGDDRGDIPVSDGTYLNIRTFARPLTDYSGSYRDNPFVLAIVQRAVTPSDESKYQPDALEGFTDIAKEGGGKIIQTPGKEDIVKTIGSLLDGATGKTLDLVLAVDTTKSMEDDIPYLQSELVPLLKKHTEKFEALRFGVVLYRDYLDEYLVKSFAFTENLDEINDKLKTITVDGGRDMPEAVYEALFEAEQAFSWNAESRLIILIGDAPPHPIPKGKITKERVYEKAAELNIQLNTIILPQ